MIDDILLSRISLFHQHLVRLPVPNSRPRFICPTHTERESGLSGLKDLLKRFLQQHPAVSKPVVPVTECSNSVFFCQGCLTDSDLRIQKIIISQLTRFNRLLMPIKQWTGFFNVGPLGKPFSPPAVIFRDFMILRQVECDNFWPEDFLLTHTVVNLFIITRNPYIWSILMSIIIEYEPQIK